MIIEYRVSSIGEGKGAWEFLSPNHFHLKNLKPHEERKIDLKLHFKKPGIYEVSASATEFNIIEVKGYAKYDEAHAVIKTADTTICAGEGWQVKFKNSEKAVMWGRRIIRCYSMHEIVTLIGAMASLIAAIFSTLIFLLRFLRLLP
ncbi:hypothetical protein KEJ32_06170 [Candidatus Bathyarchaeota archaeon]|nr:hypothetical protein [Candidatus Bathyarchaeota archaeon]